MTRREKVLTVVITAGIAVGMLEVMLLISSVIYRVFWRP